MLKFEIVSELNNWNTEATAQKFALSLKDQVSEVLADLGFLHRIHYPDF